MNITQNLTLYQSKECYPNHNKNHQKQEDNNKKKKKDPTYTTCKVKTLH